jgi:hypothetical protein
VLAECSIILFRSVVLFRSSTVFVDVVHLGITITYPLQDSTAALLDCVGMIDTSSHELPASKDVFAGLTYRRHHVLKQDCFHETLIPRAHWGIPLRHNQHQAGGSYGLRQPLSQSITIHETPH